MLEEDGADVGAELDRLNAAVAAAPPEDTGPQIALWQRVATLPTWFFIARGTVDRPSPYAVAAPQGPMVCLYSSAERADAAGRELGATTEDGSVRLLSVPMPQAIDYVASLGAAGVFGVTLDHPRIGHFIPLANLSFVKQWSQA